MPDALTFTDTAHASYLLYLAYQGEISDFPGETDRRVVEQVHRQSAAGQRWAMQLRRVFAERVQRAIRERMAVN